MAQEESLLSKIAPGKIILIQFTADYNASNQLSTDGGVDGRTGT
jgi:hypothetical protein